MTEQFQWPFDESLMVRGTTIAPEHIERAYGAKRDDLENYWRSQMRSREDIKGWFRVNAGEEVSVRQIKSSLRILTHQEQHEYTENRMRHSWRSMARSHAERCSIDTRELTEGQRSDHRKRLVLDSWILQQRISGPSNVDDMIRDIVLEEENPPD